jgi:hypothetical protein
MSKTFETIKELVSKNEVKISAHGYDEMSEDNIFIKDVIEDVANGIIIENYDKYPKGRCVLVLDKDRDFRPIHVVWGIPKGKSSPAVVVTAYRPDIKMWTDDFTRRRT